MFVCCKIFPANSCCSVNQSLHQYHFGKDHTMKIMKPEFDTFHDLLDYLVCIELRKKKLWEEEIKRLPKGSLFCCERSDGVFYYHCFNGRKVGITRDLDMLYALARKKYVTCSRRLACRLEAGASRSRQVSLPVSASYLRGPRGSLFSFVIYAQLPSICFSIRRPSSRILTAAFSSRS